VKKHYLQVAQALQWLAQYAPPRLTGTGACIFAAFANQSEAQRVINELPTDWQGFVARGTNVSPLIAAI
jgi:4-diphosphocytidyl-2-C-methyl-D-erythritol kinase